MEGILFPCLRNDTFLISVLMASSV